MDYNKSVRLHLESFWPDRKIKAMTWNSGRILEEMPDFRIFCVEPPEHENFPWVYVSSGMGEMINQEFFIISPYETPEHVEALAMLASVCFNYGGAHLNLGNVVEIGRPWLENSNLENFLISLPYPYGKKLEYMDNVRFMWLLPITNEEKDFLKDHSAEELEALFDREEIDYLAQSRRSAVDT